jgi:hypothetical protein
MEAAVLRPDPKSEFYTPERCHVIEMSNSPAVPSSSGRVTSC